MAAQSETVKYDEAIRQEVVTFLETERPDLNNFLVGGSELARFDACVDDYIEKSKDGAIDVEAKEVK